MTNDLVHIWSVPLDQPAAILDDLDATLDHEEHRRADALMTADDRRRFVVLRGATRHVAGARLGLAPERIRWSYGPHGKPCLAETTGDARISWSYSRDWGLIAITEHRAVGVDAQACPSERDARRLAARWFPAPEARAVAESDAAGRFTTLWARKEACVKAIGGRLVEGLSLAVDAPDGTVRGAAHPLRVHDVAVPDNLRAAVALTSVDDFDVVHHSWRRHA